MNRLTNEELDAIADGSGHYTDGWAVLLAALVLLGTAIGAMVYEIAVR